MLRRAQILGRREGDLLHRATLEAMAVRRASSRDARAAARRAGDWLGFAERNGVGPIVAHCIGELGTADEVAAARADAIHRASEERMAALMDQLDRVADRLAREGIALVALKNAGIARALFPCRACCPMGDIDALIPIARFRDAHRLVGELGFAHASRSLVEAADLEGALESGGAEYVRQVGEHEVWLELQWRPIAGRWLRRDQEPDGGELLARSREIEGSRARLLSAEDNLIQVALHTAKHSYVRAPGLRLHTDVDRLVAFDPPDWDRVVSQCAALEIETACYFSLAMAAALLGTSIPPTVLEALRPARWRLEAVSRWIRHINVFEPDEPKFSRPAMMVFHALLYDTATGLLASSLDTEPGRLGLRRLPENLRRGARRLYDLATRYQL